MKSLLDLVYADQPETWSNQAKEAFELLFGAEHGRYPKSTEKLVQIRAPKFRGEDDNVPFATLIEPSNPTSGPYGGMSAGLFPTQGAPCLLALGIGTTGLHPDEAILARPGHARKAQAICEMLNEKEKRFAAWAKHDPSRNDISIPDHIAKEFSTYTKIFKRYGKELYALYRPTKDRNATEYALKAFFDLYFWERGAEPLTDFGEESNRIRSEYFQHLMPNVSTIEIAELLKDRRYVVLEGPPGTGKTRAALELLNSKYCDRGLSIQFHPNTTYESFVGGLAPIATTSELGLQFQPAMGHLMRAAKLAKQAAPDPFLLHIDEINRADLSKVLGEAVMLMEQSDDSRTISLPHDFGPPFNDKLSLPPNLHILGTMNSADRSIAILDVAIRRRFAFKKLWPQYAVVQAFNNSLAKAAFERLLSIFTEFASDEVFALMPGHSYFIALEGDNRKALQSLRVNLIPLLEEYLAQGYVSGFADHIRGYRQWVMSLSLA